MTLRLQRRGYGLENLFQAAVQEANFPRSSAGSSFHLDLGFPCNLLGSRARGCDILYAKDPRDPLQPLGYFARLAPLT